MHQILRSPDSPAGIPPSATIGAGHTDDLLVARHFGFEHLSTAQAPQLGGTLSVFRHRSGLLVKSLQTDDPINSVRLVVKTPATDHSGIFHLLEHGLAHVAYDKPVTVDGHLLVPRELPLHGRNATTSPADTSYYGGSREPLSFWALGEGILSIVKHPALDRDQFYQDRGFFLQRTHEATPQFSGILFNEMLACADGGPHSASIVRSRAIFPQSAWAFESGGIPLEIARTTFERLCATYDRAYRPENMALIVSGDTPLAERLRRIGSSLEHLPSSDGSLKNLSSASSMPVDGGERVLRVPFAPQSSLSPESACSGITLFWPKSVTSNPFEHLRVKVAHEYVAETLQARLSASFQGTPPPFVFVPHQHEAETSLQIRVLNIKTDQGEVVQKWLESELSSLRNAEIDTQVFARVVEKLRNSMQMASSVGGNDYSSERLANAFAHGFDDSLLLDSQRHLAQVVEAGAQSLSQTVRMLFSEEQTKVLIMTPDFGLRAERDQLSADLHATLWSERERLDLPSPGGRGAALRAPHATPTPLTVERLKGVAPQSVIMRSEVNGVPFLALKLPASREVARICVKFSWPELHRNRADLRVLLASFGVAKGGGPFGGDRSTSLKSESALVVSPGDLAGVRVPSLAWERTSDGGARHIDRYVEGFLRGVAQYPSHSHAQVEVAMLNARAFQDRVWSSAEELLSIPKILSASGVSFRGALERMVSPALAYLDPLQSALELMERDPRTAQRERMEVLSRLFSRGAMEIHVVGSSDLIERTQDAFAKHLQAFDRPAAGENTVESPPFEIHPTRHLIIGDRLINSHAHVIPVASLDERQRGTSLSAWYLTSCLLTNYLWSTIRKEGRAYGAQSTYTFSSGTLRLAAWDDPHYLRTQQIFQNAGRQLGRTVTARDLEDQRRRAISELLHPAGHNMLAEGGALIAAAQLGHPSPSDRIASLFEVTVDDVRRCAATLQAQYDQGQYGAASIISPSVLREARQFDPSAHVVAIAELPTLFR